MMTDEGVETSVLAHRYLSTVVVIDDLPVYSPPDVGVSSKHELAAGSEHPGEPAPGLVAPAESDDDVHALPAEEISRAFASSGLVCAVIRPPESNGAEELANAAIRRADVLILDWLLAKGEDPGATAIRILQHVLSPGSRQPLRLVLIYTGEPGVADIAPILADELDGGTLVGDYDLKVASTWITVIGKPGNAAPPPERVVDADCLPDRVVEAFTGSVDGLVSGFAVSALGALRENSGRLLQRFSAELDPGLLGHRVLLPSPDDCALQLRDVLTDEINAILAADELVDASVGADRCIDRAAHLMVPDESIRVLNKRFADVDDVKAEVGTLLRSGAGEKKGPERWATELFSTEEAALQSDLRFAQLLQGRSHLASSPPVLTLGVVVEAPNESPDGFPSGYYLCLQPLCDSVRLEEARAFPFLPLDLPIGVPARLVLADRGIPVAVTARLKLHHLRSADFRPDDQGLVHAQHDDDEWYFVDQSAQPKMYRYVTRLRDIISQRLAHELGTDSSRVGTNDPEWIRRKRKLPNTDASE